MRGVVEDLLMRDPQILRRLAGLLAGLTATVLLAACGGGGGGTPPEDAAPPPRLTSVYEVDVPYIGDVDAFWARTDVYVMRPDVLPLDLWPDEVLFPSTHGIKIIVLLPGDYRGRSNGSLGDGVLYIAESGTQAEPLLVVFAPEEGADLTQTPHPAERFGESEALLTGFRIWNQTHQYLCGLTFANGIAACLMRETSHSTIDSCLWHETQFQPLRIRFGANHCLIQRCVMRRFQKDLWGSGDTVAIQVSDGTCTHNRIISNVVLNYTDSYQHTDRDGEPYGLGAGTLIDNNYFGFTSEAYVQDAAGELLCGENAIDMKMGGTQAEPVVISNNVFFGARAAQAGCAASGSGGYAVTLHRRGTWIEFTDNVFIDNDSGVFLNAFFLDNDASMGRIDPNITLTGNMFSGVTSYATAFPSRTGHVLTGTGAATFLDNILVGCDRLMEAEPIAGSGVLRIENNRLHGPLVLDPRDQPALEADGNVFLPPVGPATSVMHIPWVGRTLRYATP